MLARCGQPRLAVRAGARARLPGPEYAAAQRRSFRWSAAARAERKPWYYEMSVIFSKEAREERARKLKEETTRGRFHGPHANLA